MILTSQGYKDKKSCLNGIDSVKKNSQSDARFEVKTSSNDKEYFVLNASNGQVIGKSQMYASPGSRDAGVKAVASAAKGARVVDLTE